MRVDDAVEERPVVRHDDDRRRRRRHEALELVEPGEVEVVGRLVEQQHVLARQQDRGQRGPRAPARPTGGRPRRRAGRPAGRPRRAPHPCARRGRHRRWRGSARAPRCRPRSTSASSPSACIAASSASRGGRDPGAPGQVGAQRLAGVGVGLLRQEADRRGRRRPRRPTRRRAPPARPGPAAASTSRSRSVRRCPAARRVHGDRHPAEHHLRPVVALHVPGHEHEIRRYRRRPDVCANVGQRTYVTDSIDGGAVRWSHAAGR